MTAFICPNCGFKDSPCWRNSRFQIYTVYCRIDELQEFEPKIAERLLKERHIEMKKRGKLVSVEIEEGEYYYQLTKTEIVNRTSIELKYMLKHGHFTEKHKSKGRLPDPFQQKF